MKKQTKSNRRMWIPMLLGGAACIALSALAGWDAVAHHDGRLVYPMDSYAFQASDIPMLLAIGLDCLYVLALFVLLVRAVYAQWKQAETTNRTRRISPKFGLLGFLGFFGFAGFWSYGALGDLTPFCFFVFFGFFGFFFEGKMSDTLMDERYRENAARAERTAYRTGFTIIFLLLIFAAQSNKVSAGGTVAILLAGIALAVALTMFLGEYLLYRYDHDGTLELEEE